MSFSIPRGRGTTIVLALIALTAVALYAAVASPARGGAATVRAKLIDRFDQPVYVTGPPRSRGRLFVVEKRGRIVSINRHGKTSTFLNIEGRVAGNTEQGLLSVAFAPKYRKNRRFYVYYTEKQHGDIVVAEFRRSRKHAGKAVAKSRRTVIRIQHRMAPNHNGGQLQFGPDGYLYLGTGDGGGGGDPKENAQNKDSLLGKLLRIDPRRRHGKPYTVPSSNPFVGRPGRDEIYSYGLRNPYRFSFDRRGGHLVIGDVGQEKWEEIDYLTRKAANGANFGWDAYEGRAPYEVRPIGPHVDPIQVYSHAGGNCSVTGGYVYRGPRAPSLRGRYVYADFCGGQIRSLIPAVPRARDDRPVGLPGFSGISSFGEDAKGNLYFTDLRGGGVYEIVAGRR